MVMYVRIVDQPFPLINNSILEQFIQDSVHQKFKRVLGIH